MIRSSLRRSRKRLRSFRARRSRCETLEQRMLLASDLLPIAFSGWDDAIVISSNQNDNTDDPITVADTIFFDFGWANIGDTSTGGTYAVEGRLNGNIIAVNSSIPDTNPFNGFAFTDISAGPLPAGQHTVTFEVDVNDEIAEDNEQNNFFSRTFVVGNVGTEDFGDAPSSAQSGFASSYPVTLADDGARHTPLNGFTLGTLIDTEGDGTHDAGAAADDSLSDDDEDGVTFSDSLQVGEGGSVEVVVTNTAGVANPYLDVWIDFNLDGDWQDTGELVFSGAAVAGVNTVNFTVPTAASPGTTFARFRLHDGTTGLATTGLATEGEVEDHAVQIIVPGAWVEQGPHGTINGQLEFGTQPNRRVTGAIHTVLAHPTDPDTLYIGGVNGGIWKTENATDVLPNWTPQTDFLESLAIGAMAFDVTDATSNTLVAGTAKYSSFAGFGGIRGPVYRTTDGGANWTQLGSNGLRAVGENISGIAARGSTIIVTSSGNFGGIFRSTDTGANFTPVSDSDFNSPNDDFYDLVEDFSDPGNQRLYAASGGISGSGGIYRSDDFGVNWTKISTGNAELDDLVNSSNNIEMAVHPTTGRIFVATLVSGQPRGVFYSSNPTSATPTWTRMDVPVLPLGGGAAITGATNATPIEITSAGHGLSSGNFVVVDGVTGNEGANGFYRVTVTGTNTFRLDDSAGTGAYAGGGTWNRVTGPNPRAKDIDETGAQGRIHFSIATDPSNDDIVYIGGDRQDQPSPIGDNTFGGAVFRGDASIARNPNVAPSPQWDHATHDIVPGVDPDGGTANGTAPHADSREIVFDANGDLIEVDDGGIYRRTNRLDNTGDWFSLAGNLGVIEFHDVAYDSTSDIIIGGTQDNGTHFQQTPNGKEWDFLSGGDGGDAAVDTITLAAQNRSIRFSSSQNLGGFRRTTWDASNNLVSTQFPSLTITSGPAFGPAFKTPFQLNRVDPMNMLFIGSNGVFESPNQGDTLEQVSPGSLGFLQDAVDYGGFQGGVPNEEVFYVGLRDDLHIRTSVAGGVTVVDPDTSSSQDIEDVVMNSDDWANAFAIDNNQVWQTTDAGATWTDVTGALMSIAGAALQSITFIPGSIGAIAVGANQGVFVSRLDMLGTWAEVGANLPNVLVFDLIYDQTDDVLLAGTLGRGAWTLPNASDLLAGGDFDFGDAPNATQSGFAASYPVTTADDGARHGDAGPTLGPTRDLESDGIHSAAADGDDTAGADDEDGVLFGEIATDRSLAAVNLELAGTPTGLVDAWIDFNRDGDWDDAGEQILASELIDQPLQTINYALPAGLTAGETYARVRISSTGGLAPTGAASDGEVEDYRVNIIGTVGTPVEVESVLVNGGDASRSHLTTVQVTFNQIVTAPQDAFVLRSRDNNEEILNVLQVGVPDNSSGKSVVDITFAVDDGTYVLDRSNGEHSLKDGHYDLRVLAEAVHAVTNGPTPMAADFIFGDSSDETLFRFFADADGNRNVDFLDFGAYGITHLADDAEIRYDARFDHIGNGNVDLLDFGQYGLRHLQSRPFV